MTESTRPTVPKWPFFLSDAFMLGIAWFVFNQSKLPLDAFGTGAICACVALGAILAIIPFVLDYRVTLKIAETEALTDVASQLQNLETIATQISQATGQWQTANEHSSKAVTAAGDIGERMTTEAKAFAEFMQKANDAEKSTLRLEVEKLRRAETDWVQVVVRMLDHTFALHAAASRSGKTALIEQLNQFQNALRDSARRVGLTPFSATAGDAFDSAKHQLAESETPAADATVHGTLALGFTFRNQLIRPALVSLVKDEPEATSTATPESDPRDSQEPTLL